MRAAVVLLAVGAVAVLFAGANTDRSQLRFRPVASGLRGAWFIGAPRSEPGKLYIVQKGGRIRVLVNGHLRKQPFLDIYRLNNYFPIPLLMDNFNDPPTNFDIRTIVGRGFHHLA